MSKHTPAPWTVKRMGENWSQLTGGTPGLIADIHKDVDVALIAAAPELLAALLNLLQIAEGARENTANHAARQFQQMHIDAARAAIAKAGGAA